MRYPAKAGFSWSRGRWFPNAFLGFLVGAGFANTSLAENSATLNEKGEVNL